MTDTQVEQTSTDIADQAARDNELENWLEAEAEWKASYNWFDPTPEWPYHWIDFEGDRLAVRVPSASALASYAVATSPGSSPVRRNRYTRLLLEGCTSAESYERILDRSMAPDDEAYGGEEAESALARVIAAIIDLKQPPKPDNRAERRHPTS